jgi:hypothetical protein
LRVEYKGNAGTGIVWTLTAAKAAANHPAVPQHHSGVAVEAETRDDTISVFQNVSAKTRSSAGFGVSDVFIRK